MLETPNIVYILADDLGYGDLGCYGQKRFATPNIDRMAAEGMRFTQHYSGSTVCAPSRCALMTGLHTGHTAVRDNEGPYGAMPLGPSDVTVAQVLKEAGYSTAVIGKWDMAGPDAVGIPNRHGFDYSFGFLHSSYSLYWEFREQQAVRIGDWKGVRPEGEEGGLELYDLKNDVGEQEDLSGQHPEIRAKIKQILETSHDVPRRSP